MKIKEAMKPIEV